jgi:hypothetical protein
MPRAGLGRVRKKSRLTGLAPLFDPVDASHHRTGKHLHDRAASFGRRFRLHGDVTTGAANRVVNAEASSHHTAADQEQRGECECELSHCRSNGDLPSKVADVSTALGRAPTYDGDERADQEHNSGSDRETCDPRPDLLCLLLDLFPFLRRHVHRSHVFQHFLRSHVLLAFRAASSPFSKYTNPIVDLKYSLS